MSDRHFLQLLDEIKVIHEEKSAAYGTALYPFANFYTVARYGGHHVCEYPLLRIIEKCTRAHNMIKNSREEEIEEFMDIAGLALCAEVLRREAIQKVDRRKRGDV